MNQLDNSIAKPDMFLGAAPHLFEKAHQLRQHETEAEKLLWSKLSRKQLGAKFRRQHPIYTYIADFYCHSHRLVIEVDGPIHNTPENKEYDKVRSQAFTEFKIDIIRFSNEDVMNNLDSVIKRISDHLKSYPLHDGN